MIRPTILPGTPEVSTPVIATGTSKIPIYFDRAEFDKQSERCLFDDESLHAKRYPWRNDGGPTVDVTDEATSIVFREYRRNGPHEFGVPIVFKLYDLNVVDWSIRGTFISQSAEGLVNLSLTSLEPADAPRNQRESLSARILDECNFPRLVQYVVASQRDQLSRFNQTALATDARLMRFFEHLRYWKIENDDRGRGFDYMPKITSSIP